MRANSARVKSAPDGTRSRSGRLHSIECRVNCQTAHSEFAPKSWPLQTKVAVLTIQFVLGMTRDEVFQYRYWMRTEGDWKLNMPRIQCFNYPSVLAAAPLYPPNQAAGAAGPRALRLPFCA
jgi:hypothetical protein